MRTITIVLVAVVLAGLTTSVGAQTVVTYYPAPAPVATYYAPGVPVTTYYAPSATYYAPSVPVATYYAPAVTTTYYYSPYIVRPKVYVRGQPIRNVLRAITP